MYVRNHWIHQCYTFEAVLAHQAGTKPIAAIYVYIGKLNSPCMHGIIDILKILLTCSWVYEHNSLGTLSCVSDEYVSSSPKTNYLYISLMQDLHSSELLHGYKSQ